MRIQTITDDIADSLGVKANTGALVSGVTPGGPGEASGLRAGDVILAFGGQKVSSMKGLPRLVARAKIGQPAKVEILRQGKKQTLNIVVGRMKEGDDFARLPKSTANSKATGADTVLGLGLSSLTASVRDQLGLSKAMRGIVVTSVDVTQCRR